MNEKNKLYYSWHDFDNDIKSIGLQIRTNVHPKPSCVFGIPKGGLVLAVKLANVLNIPMYLSLKKARRDFSNRKEILVVDDICDSGKTLSKIKNFEQYYTVIPLLRYTSKVQPNFYITKILDDRWVVFPWESKSTVVEKQGTYEGE